MIVKLLTKHHFGVSKLKRMLQRPVRVYTCQNATLLEISCAGSFSKHALMINDFFLDFLFQLFKTSCTTEI